MINDVMIWFLGVSVFLAYLYAERLTNRGVSVSMLWIEVVAGSKL